MLNNEKFVEELLKGTASIGANLTFSQVSDIMEVPTAIRGSFNLKCEVALKAAAKKEKDDGKAPDYAIPFCIDAGDKKFAFVATNVLCRRAGDVYVRANIQMIIR